MSHPALDSFGDLEHAARDPHVTGCPQCQAELAAQQQVRDLLAGLPDPGPTPPDVVDRIEATLRRLSAEAAASPTSSPAAGATVVPMRAAAERRRRRPLFAVAAAAALVVVAGVGVSQLVQGSSGGASSSAAGAALRESPRKDAGAPAAALRATASGTSYTRDAIAQQVQQVMGAPAQAAAGGVTGPLATPAGVAQCLAAIGSPQATPLLVDVARFEGKPAAVLVVPATGGGREIWVVATTCAPAPTARSTSRACADTPSRGRPQGTSGPYDRLTQVLHLPLARRLRAHRLEGAS